MALPTGEADPSFGDGGVVRVPTTAQASGAGIDGRGRVIVAGTSAPDDEARYRTDLFRLLRNGDVDRSYGSNGHVVLDPGPGGQNRLVAVGPDGGAYLSHLVLGETGVIRLDPGGNVDSDFADRGQIRVTPQAVQVHGDRLVVWGYTNGEQNSFVASYTLDGRGISYIDLDLFIVSIAVQPDGSVVIADRPAFHRLHRGDNTPYERLVLHRITPTGAVDPTFGDQGSFDTGRRASFAGILAGPDGRLYVYGGVVLRLDADGRVDATYGDCGPGGEGLLDTGDAFGVDHAGRVLYTDGSIREVRALQGDAGGPQVEPTPDSRSWMVTADGVVADMGLACWYGDARRLPLRSPVVGIDATRTGHGYWLGAADGGVFGFGDAPFHGSMGASRLNRPVVGISATPSGGGYWLVAADGGVFSFGDAEFHGSLGGRRMRSKVVAMTPTPSGHGYWLLADDGGVFTFGDAPFAGSAPGTGPYVGIAASDSGRGYWLQHRNGGLVGFGDATVPSDRGSFIYQAAYTSRDAVAIEPIAGYPRFRRLFASCCPDILGGRPAIAFDVR
jgi:hypothetical protein